MKTFKRIGCAVALLLAMALLTACSDGKTYYERAMENVPLPKGCSRWQYLPNDYDGDGEIEVFAFGGEEDTQYKQWLYLQVYYIDSNGNVQKVDVGKNLGGAPRGKKADFSDCYLTIGKQTYARFNVGDVGGGCGYELLFSVYNGKPTESSVDGGIDEVTADGYVIGSSQSEIDDIYVSKNGRLEFVESIYKGD